jgi:hypothetical protein
VASAAANLVQHVVGDLKKGRTAKVLDLTKRFLQRRPTKTEAELPIAAVG